MTTTVDQLIFILGLDPTNFNKGQKEAIRSLLATKETTRKASNEMSSSLMGVARTFGLLFLGVESVKAGFQALANLNNENAALGRFATNTAQSAHEVNQWGLALQLAGGKAEDAQADIGALSASITQLRTTGQASPLLSLFQHLQVPLTDAQGKTRSLVELYKDLGDRLRTLPRQDAYNLGRQAGISDSTLNLILQEKAARDEILRTAEAKNLVDEQATKNAQELLRAWTEIKQGGSAFFQLLLNEITPAVKDLAAWWKNLTGGMEIAGAVAHEIGLDVRLIVDLIKLAVDGWKQLIAAFGNTKFGAWVLNKLGAANSAVKSSRESFLDDLHARASHTGDYADDQGADTRTRGLRNNNPGNLKYAGQAGATSDDKGFAVFPTQAAGIAATSKQLDLYASRGVNTIGSIVNTYAPGKDGNDVKAYVVDLVKQVGKGADEPLTPADRQQLLRAIFSHESGAGAVSAATISSVLGPNPSALSASRGAGAGTALTASAGAPGASGVTYQTQIDSIQVNTAATDANGIAADIRQAITRKGIVGQADPGMTS